MYSNGSLATLFYPYIESLATHSIICKCIFHWTYVKSNHLKSFIDFIMPLYMLITVGATVVLYSTTGIVYIILFIMMYGFFCDGAKGFNRFFKSIFRTTVYP